MKVEVNEQNNPTHPRITWDYFKGNIHAMSPEHTELFNTATANAVANYKGFPATYSVVTAEGSQNIGSVHIRSETSTVDVNVRYANALFERNRRLRIVDYAISSLIEYRHMLEDRDNLNNICDSSHEDFMKELTGVFNASFAPGMNLDEPVVKKVQDEDHQCTCAHGGECQCGDDCKHATVVVGADNVDDHIKCSINAVFDESSLPKELMDQINDVQTYGTVAMKNMLRISMGYGNSRMLDDVLRSLRPAIKALKDMNSKPIG